MVDKQRALLRLVNKVAREDLSQAVNDVLDAVSTYLADKPEFQSEMYKMTLDVLRANNERLWFTICLKLAKIYQDMAQTEALDGLLSELKNSCRVAGTQSYD